MATRHPVEIAVFTGTFESQPLAFAHLYDASAEIDLAAVEVICKSNPVQRLRHYFDEATIDAVIDGMGLNTTVVLVFPEALPAPLDSTERLTSLGTFPGTRLRA